MQGFLDFLTNYADAITVAVAILGIVGSILGVIWAVWKFLIKRWWKQRLKVDVKVFEVITDPNVLLKKLYATENDNSPLADHNIKYQPRDPNRDIQAELKSALNHSRYLLITAPTGYGKTREAGVLAQTMMLEGWRVLRIKTGWLDTPKELPAELNSSRSRVLILLDDLNGLFSTGNLTQSPRAEQIPMLSETSYHDRLLNVLDMLEKMCTENEIRVIATARSEADQWKLLEYDSKDALWKKFTRFEIPEPNEKTIVNLLEDTTKQSNLKANENEFEDIARKNDGTYRNIVLNLRRLAGQEKIVSKDDFTETLNGSWGEIYTRLVKQHPPVRFVYDAIDILRQADIELFTFLIKPVAITIWGGNPIQQFFRARKIGFTIKYLTTDARVLRFDNSKIIPSDGQIEAKSTRVLWTDYIDMLTNLLLHPSDTRFKSTSIFNFASSCYYSSNFSHTLRLTKRYIELHPSDDTSYYNLGILLSDLNRKDEAENAYRKAIELNPSNYKTYTNLGVLLSDLNRMDEAENAYYKAVELNSSNDIAYANLASLLRDLKRYNEAEAAYRKVIEFIPKDFTSYLAIASITKQSGKGISKENIKKVRQLIPADDWYNLTCLESVCDNFDLAFEYLEKATKVESFDSAWAWKDPDLQWIQDDPRFIKIVGAKPE